MSVENDYFLEYMNEAEGTPEPIIKGVLLFFQSTFGEQQIEEMVTVLSNQDEYTLKHTEKVLKAKYNVGEEIIRQITQLMQKKFKDAIEAKEKTQEKLAFIRSIKKKH
ncbi:MAG: hypothetical protein ACFFDW_10820 [Candidatus Thorarchaeota archaeon]